MERDKQIREQLVKHVKGGLAFTPLKDILNKLPFEKTGERPADLPYSAYELFYHITYAQKDILNYCKEDSYKSPDWHDDYWPENKAPEDNEEWESLKKNYFQERDEFVDFLLNEENGLMKPVRKGEDHTLLREALLVIEHTSFHTGQLLILLRLMGLHNS